MISEMSFDTCCICRAIHPRKSGWKSFGNGLRAQLDAPARHFRQTAHCPRGCDVLSQTPSSGSLGRAARRASKEPGMRSLLLALWAGSGKAFSRPN